MIWKSSSTKKPRSPAFAAWLCIFVTASLLLGTQAKGVLLANYQKQGLRAYTIEGMLRLPDDQIDIGTAALILSRQWGSQRTLYVYRRKIDDMAEAILKKLHDQHLPVDHRAINIINNYLFEELGFSAVDTSDNPEDLFLHNVLDKKRGYCLSLSILYLAVGERLGLPVYGVVVPGHFFVRYDDGRYRFNIETTSKGAGTDDAHYIDKFKPPSNPHMLYMKNLTAKQTLGCFFNNLGNSYTAVGDIDKAFESLLRAVQINPLLSEANVNLGNIYLQKKMPHQAIAQYEKALTILGSDPKVMNNLGSAYMQLSNYSRAESYYKTALSLDPQYADVYRNLAGALQMQGKFEEAVSQLQAAVVLNPKDAEAFARLGQIFRQLQRFPEAEKNLSKALMLDSSLASARISLGHLYLDQSRLEEAQEAFSSALQSADAAAQAYFGLAQIYHQKGQTDDEISSYEQALAIDPSMTAALQNLGNAYSRKGNDAAAIDTYQKAIRIDPQNADLHYNLGVTLAKIQKHEQAIKAFLEAIKLDAGNASAYNGIAISYYQLGNKELARTYAQKAKSLGFETSEALLK